MICSSRSAAVARSFMRSTRLFMPDRDSLEGIDYANSPRARFGYKKLCDITDEDIQWLKGAVSRYSAKYVNNVLMVLNKLLKVAEEWRVIDTLPCRIQLLRVTHPTPGFYEYEQYEQLVEDVPKGGRGRIVPMTEALSNALASHRHLRGERVLLQDDGEILTPKIVRNWMISAQRRAGLDPKGAVHILRHTFCSHLAMRGAPAKAIQELAGHQNLQTTLRYMHLSPAAREGAIRLL